MLLIIVSGGRSQLILLPSASVGWFHVDQEWVEGIGWRVVTSVPQRLAGSLLNCMIRSFVGMSAATAGLCGSGAGLPLALVGPLRMLVQGLEQIGAWDGGTGAAALGAFSCNRAPTFVE
jgi:hypothetical protein